MSGIEVYILAFLAGMVVMAILILIFQPTENYR